jgi:putative lipoprotein (rSAM/lipoprotein system)
MTRLVSRAICLVLGGILGVGCHNPTDTRAEYGVPSARYRLDGTVTARETGQPVRGIRLFLARGGRADSTVAATSDADGRWQMDGRTLSCSASCAIVTADVDGPENGGLFAPQTQVLLLEQTERGDGHWYWGTFEQHGIAVILDPEPRVE